VACEFPYIAVWQPCELLYTCYFLTYSVAGRSGRVVSASACGVRGSRFVSQRGRLFIAMATAMCSLGHGLHLTAMPILSLQPFGVAKSSTSIGCGKGGNVTSAGWQVTLCDGTWHVSSRSGVAMSHCELLYSVNFTLCTLLWSLWMRTTTCCCLSIVY